MAKWNSGYGLKNTFGLGKEEPLREGKFSDVAISEKWGRLESSKQVEKGLGSRKFFLSRSSVMIRKIQTVIGGTFKRNGVVAFACWYCLKMRETWACYIVMKDNSWRDWNASLRAGSRRYIQKNRSNLDPKYKWKLALIMRWDASYSEWTYSGCTG